MRLLLAGDDGQLATRLADRLRGAGFDVDVTASDTAAPARPGTGTTAAIILDLPDGGGMPLLSAWRQGAASSPILILTARGRWQDKLEALNAGADDFVMKPVRFEELLVRIHAVLRRHHGSGGTWIERDGLRMDTQARKAELHGQPLSLTRMEFRLLHLFLRRAGHVLSQADILSHLYDLEGERQLNAVEVLISRLRRKIGTTRIETVRGLGYRFVA